MNFASTHDDAPPSALSGIRILDLSRVLAGPYCTQTLGDLGADIIKIEKPHAGDDTRKWGPPFLKDDNGDDTQESAYYLSCNRNKRSLAVDITEQKGQEIIHRLLDKTDIIIQNFKVGGLKKYGLSYDQLKDRYPALIYCSISGFGSNGPMANEPGYDFIAQAVSGLMACTGEPDGAPMKVGVALSDVMTGMNATSAILAALFARTRSGKGQHIDLALTDSTLAAQVNIAQYYLTSGENAPRLGNGHSTIVPYNAFKTTDGYIIIAVGNDGQFKKFSQAINRVEWIEDNRYKTNTARIENRNTLVPAIAVIIKTKSQDEWLDIFKKAGVPCAPVNTIEQVFAMEQTQARDMRITMNHPQAQKPISLVGSPLKLSETPVSYTYPPPVAGQHTHEILEKTLGFSADEIEQLKKDGIIEQADI